MYRDRAIKSCRRRGVRFALATGVATASLLGCADEKSADIASSGAVSGSESVSSQTPSVASAQLEVGTLSVGPREVSEAWPAGEADGVKLISSFVVANDTTNDKPLLINATVEVPRSTNDHVAKRLEIKVFCSKPGDPIKDSGLGNTGSGDGAHDSQSPERPFGTYVWFFSIDSDCPRPYAAVVFNADDEEEPGYVGWELSQK